MIRTRNIILVAASVVVLLLLLVAVVGVDWVRLDNLWSMSSSSAFRSTKRSSSTMANENKTSSTSKRTRSKNDDDATWSSTISLKLVSFNLAGCVPSKEAPPDWNTTTVARAVAQEILQHHPDVICLQECPQGGAAWARQYFDNYTVVGSTPSHADTIVLLVRSTWEATCLHDHTSEPNRRGTHSLPAVLARVSPPHQPSLYVASVHLAPFADGSEERFEQMRALLELTTVKNNSLPLIVAGDTNMRATEDYGMEMILGHADAWKVSGGANDTQFTWDTMDHGHSFNRFYGDGTRPYRARYDRVYLYSSLDSVSNVWTVPNFSLLGNRPVTTKYHFLSDHFGIVLTIVWHSN